MYNRLKRLYSTGAIDDAALNNAAIKGWISEEEKASILS